MKTLSISLCCLLSLSLTFIISPFFAHAQSATNNAAAVKTLLDSGNYVFHAQSALPMQGTIHQLPTDYTVKVTKGKITVDLPYFGQAYAPPTDPTQSGIQFTTTAFDYFYTPRKKDGWNIRIKPKDAKDVQQVLLTISSEGYTSLQVTSLSRQPITFNGYVAALTQK